MIGLARRMAGLGPSPIRAFGLCAPPDAVRLGLGEPGWALPAEARAALAQGTGPCAYGPNEGLPELRTALAVRHGVTLEETMVGCGSQGVLHALLQAWVEQDDQVLVPDPGFPAYPTLARLAGAAPVPYSLAPGGGLDPESFRRALGGAPRAKVALINHPSNPTGAGAAPAALAAVAEACAARSVLLISDEVYQELYLEQPAPGLRGIAPGAVVLGSLSKAWGAAGLRVGWGIGPAEYLQPARLVHGWMVTAPARPSQEAALALLAASERVLPAARHALRARWELLREALFPALGFEPPAPAGGFFLWLEVPERFRGAPLEFCTRLRDEGGVVIVPGEVFGGAGRGRLRLSFGGDPVELAEGARRMARFWRTA